MSGRRHKSGMPKATLTLRVGESGPGAYHPALIENDKPKQHNNEEDKNND